MAWFRELGDDFSTNQNPSAVTPSVVRASTQSPTGRSVGRVRAMDAPTVCTMRLIWSRAALVTILGLSQIGCNLLLGNESHEVAADSLTDAATDATDTTDAASSPIEAAAMD